MNAMMKLSLKFCRALFELVGHLPDTKNFSTRYIVMCKVYTGYRATCKTEHGLSACMVVVDDLSVKGDNHALYFT